jgi:hypothetical protein
VETSTATKARIANLAKHLYLHAVLLLLMLAQLV